MISTRIGEAIKRVVQNKGAAGVDGLTVFEFKAWLQPHWPRIREVLLAGEYQLAAVRKVEIPKPGGGVRMLGIPTVPDRPIQQALLQVLQPEFEADFSEHSYGFRPGRNAWQAVQRAQSYISEGHRWVVDLDLEKFFDHVNHDILMINASQRCSGRTGRMDTTQTALSAMAAMEAPGYTEQETTGARYRWHSGMEIGK